MKVRYFLLFLTIAVKLPAIVSCAQVNNPPIIPPSPRSAEYAKYITYNVSLYNGIPEISIPLYNIQLKGLTIPIALNYHASGIKFNQDKGEVGLGWTLSAGYRVSRTIYGRADDRYSFPSYLLDSLNYHESNNPEDRDKYLARFLPIEDGDPGSPTRPNAKPGLEVDGEYDQFKYNLPSESGSFIITDRVGKIITSLEESNARFDYNTGTSANGWAEGILGFEITDNSGVKYFLGEAVPLNGNYVFESISSDHDSDLNTAWALTDIRTPLGDNAHFNYLQRFVAGWDYAAYSFSITEARPEFEGFSYNLNDEGAGQSYSTFELQDIVTTQERMTFERGIDGTILNIRVYVVESNQLLKRIEFVYDGDFLEAVKIHDKSDNEVETYRFDYHKKDARSVYTFIPDQWGYYMPARSFRDLFHEQMGVDLVMTSYDPYTQEPVSNYLGDFSKRDYVTSVPDYFSLKRIVFPTGGTTEYEYESNKYSGVGGVKTGGGIRIKKIKSNDQLNGEVFSREFVYGANASGYGSAQLDLSHQYFTSERINFIAHGAPGAVVPQRTITYTSYPQGDIDPTGGLSSYVRYSTVTEYLNKSTREGGWLGKIVYSFDVANQAGFNAYPAAYVNPLSYHGSFPQYVSRYSYWNKPTLTGKTTYRYDEDLNSYSPVREETFIYSSGGPDYTGLKVKPFAIATPYHSSYEAGYYSFTNSFFNYGTYTVQSGRKNLIEKKDKNITSNGQFETRTTYNYNALNQLTKETLYDSKGRKFSTYYRYANDVASAESTNAQSNPIGFMVKSNMISKPLEILKTMEDAGLEKVLSSKVTTYKGVQISPDGSVFYTVLPDQTYELEVTDFLSVDNYAPFAVNAAGGVESNILDPSLKSRLSFDEYDLYGNLRQFTPADGASITYLWGYGGRFPVAECKNASSNEFYYEDFEATGNSSEAHTGSKGYSTSYTPTFDVPNNRLYYIGWWSFAGSAWHYNEEPYSGQTLSGVIDDVCIFPKDALLSTYTFSPLVGMTSSTDADGLTKYYEYDDYQRLIRIKDQNRDIIEKFEYKYADPAVRYYSTERTISFQKNDCPSGYMGSTVEYRVSAGAYVSMISQSDAESQADQDITNNGQDYANLYGTCLQIYYSATASADFTRNNCASGMTGSTVNYTVPAGTYNSIISQEDADQKAQHDVAANGQAYANAQGTCNGLYYSVQKSGYFTRSNCGSGYEPGPSVQYTVPAGTYTSTVSQADADLKAQQDVNTNGPSYANTNGTCIPIVEFSITRSIYEGSILQVQFWKTAQLVATFYPTNSSNIETFSIAAGTYDKVIVELTADPGPYFYLSFSNGSTSSCFELSGTGVIGIVFQNITLMEDSNTFLVEEYCQ